MGKLVAVGLSHHAAPIEIRERVAIDESVWRSVAPPRVGSILLSTCNRVEVYAWVEDHSATAARALTRSLAQAAGMRVRDIQPYLVVRTGREAVLHLVRVASGLDSMVVGEEQIRGQVRQALRAAEGSGPLPSPLRGIFQRVGDAARRVRGGTTLGAAPSIASAGVNVALRTVAGGSEPMVAVVLGAGVMARAATEALVAHNVRVRVLNRTPGHAERLFGHLPSVAISPLSELQIALRDADLLVGATASRTFVVAPESLPDRPLVMLDIALPRDIDPRVRERQGVTLIDLDDLERMCPVDARTRDAEHQRAEALAAAEAGRLMEWLRFRAVGPTIAELRMYAETIRTSELRRSASRLRDLTPEQVAAVDALTAGIVKKLMHGPTIALRDAAARSRSRILRVVRPPRGRAV